MSLVTARLGQAFRRITAASILISPGLGALAQASPPAATALSQEFDCVLKPSKEVRVSAPVTGVLGSVLVDRGSLVRKGEVIAALDSQVEAASVALAKRRSEAAAKVNSATAKVAFLQKKMERSKKLSVTQIVSESAHEEAETNLAVAREELDDARLEVQMAKLELVRATVLLDQRTVRSPIAGVVTERKLSPGEYWSEREPVVTLVGLDPLHVETFVPIAMHGRIKRGARATIRPEEPIGGRHVGSVDVIDRVYDAASGTFGLRLVLPNSSLEIPAGIRCKISFEQDAKG